MQQATLVTGGASGIGLAIANQLIADGQAVIVMDKDGSPATNAAIHVQVDLADTEATRHALHGICAEYQVTRLVNNAAHCQALPIAEDDLQNLVRSAAVNLKCPVLCAQAVLPAMTNAGFGRIVNIGSRGAYGKEHRLSYNATKGGLNVLTRAWALEFATLGITVNGVAPGVVDTELYHRYRDLDPAQTRRTNASIPMGRLGEPDEVAQAVSFFLSERASYITGQLLFVCGGLSIGRQPSE